MSRVPSARPCRARSGHTTRESPLGSTPAPTAPGRRCFAARHRVGSVRPRALELAAEPHEVRREVDGADQVVHELRRHDHSSVCTCVRGGRDEHPVGVVADALVVQYDQIGHLHRRAAIIEFDHKETHNCISVCMTLCLCFRKTTIT